MPEFANSSRCFCVNMVLINKPILQPAILQATFARSLFCRLKPRQFATTLWSGVLTPQSQWQSVVLEHLAVAALGVESRYAVQLQPPRIQSLLRCWAEFLAKFQ